MADPFDYGKTAGMYNRFLAEGEGDSILSNRDMMIESAIRSPQGGRTGAETAELMGARSQLGKQYSRDSLLTQALLGDGEGRSEADSLKLVEGLSPAGRKVYENFYSNGKSRTEDKIIDSFLQQDNKYKMGE